jgi:toxin-antitoxin system PIN domain toxin
MPDPTPSSPGTRAIDLLDINVWLALVDENHAHHPQARQYWQAESAPQLAFTRVSMLGFVRLLTNTKAMAGNPFTARQAWDAYRAFRQLPEIIWIGDVDEGAQATDDVLATWIGAPGFSTLHWTDGYLAAIAKTYGCRLVSFDGGYDRFQPLNFLHLTA